MLLVIAGWLQGVSWSPPVALNNNAGSDSGDDFNVALTTDRQGAWLAAWSATEDLAGPADSDSDIAFARSFDRGLTWSAAMGGLNGPSRVKLGAPWSTP